MSKKQAISFFKEVAKNKQLAEKVNEVVGGQATNQAKAAKLLSLAKKNHFDFTKKEAALAKDELKTALQIEDLSEVSGGQSKVMSAVMAAALLTGGLGVTGATTNVESSAMFARWFGGGKDSGKPAPTDKKGDSKDDRRSRSQSKTKTEAELANMSTEDLVQTVLRLQTQLTQSQMQGRERVPSQLRSQSTISNETEINVQDEMQKMEIQRLKSELAMTQKAMDRLGETAGDNLEAMAKIQRENEELKKSNAKLLEESKQRGGGWFGFGGRTTNSADTERIQQLEEENRALKEQLEEQERNFLEEIDRLADTIVEDAEIIRKQKILLQQASEMEKRLQDKEENSQNIHAKDAEAVIQLRDEREALRERENTHIEQLFQRMFPRLRQMLALHMPTCASVAIPTRSGTRTVEFTVYDDDLSEGEVQLPRIGWLESMDRFDVRGILTVREDGVYHGDELLAKFNEDGVAELPEVPFLPDYREGSYSTRFQLPIQVVRSDQRRPRNTSPHLIFSDGDLKSACFGVLPGREAASSNKSEYKWHALKSYMISNADNVNNDDEDEIQNTEMFTQNNSQNDDDSVSTNHNNLNNNSSDEISDMDMLTQDTSQTTETQQQSSNRTQRTYNLHGQEVPVYQWDYNVEDLYRDGGVTLSNYGTESVTYSPSEVVSGNLFAGPGNNSVVEFHATDSHLYNVNPDTGDVTANFVFDPQYRGYTTSLSSAVDFLANISDSNSVIQLDESAPNIFNGLGLVGANGSRGNFIVNVNFF